MLHKNSMNKGKISLHFFFHFTNPRNNYVLMNIVTSLFIRHSFLAEISFLMVQIDGLSVTLKGEMYHYTVNNHLRFTTCNI